MSDVRVEVPVRPTVVPVPVPAVPQVTSPEVVATTPTVSVVPAPLPRPVLEAWESGTAEYDTVFDFVGSTVYIGEAKGTANSTGDPVWRIGRFFDDVESPEAVYANGGEFTCVWDSRYSYDYGDALV